MGMLSLKSNAFEPTKKDLAGMSAGQRIWHLLPVYGLPILTVLLIGLFTLLLPDTFPTAINFRSILGNNAIVAMLALAAMVPMMAGRIDLTVGYGIVLWHILVIGLQVQHGLPWGVAVLIVLVCGALLGLVNALLVELAQIDSFIATLGTGTIIYALALWYTGGRQVVGTLPKSFTTIYGWYPFGVPVAAFYVLILSVILWIAAEFLPVGRYLYAIGANPRAAMLNGIRTRRYTTGAFVLSGVIGALAGVVLAAKLRIGQASVGLEFLLPALVGAFLGSTTIKLGRVNVWGTVVGIIILGVGISGIEQLGGAFFVEPLFNGVMLIIAIGLAGYAQQRRRIVKHVAEAQTQGELDTSDPPDGDPGG